MLHPFISDRTPRAGDHLAPGGLTTSVLVHASVIALAIAATTAPASAPGSRSPRGAFEHVVFTGVAHMEPSRAVAAAARTVLRRARRGFHLVHEPARDATAELALLDLADAALAAEAADGVKIDVPTVDLDAMAGGSIAWARNELAEYTGAVRALPRPNAGNAYTEDVVEKVVAPYGDNPRPRYPEFLQASAVEGSFTVRYVVDSTGRVDKHSLEFPHAMHRLFISSVRDALLHSRFIPAEVAGRRVAQLVQQRFSFVIQH